MKPMLKVPGTKRLKLKYVKLLSILVKFRLHFAFNFNLRRCTKGCESISGACTAKSGVGESCGTR